MKVLHIGKYYSPFQGGIENFTRDLVESKLYQQSTETVILAHHECNGKSTSHEHINGVKVIKVKRQGVLLYAPICMSFLTELNRVISEFQPHIIHIHMPNLSAFACLFSKLAKAIPWVVHWHSDVLGQLPDWRIKLAYKVYSIFEEQMLVQAKCIIATSTPYLENSNVLQRHRNKCSVIPLGIKSLAYNVEKSQQPSNTLRLLIIGRLTYYKGHRFLIEALQNVDYVELRIIGHGELETELQALTSKLDLDSKVTFLGRLEEKQLYQEIERCDLLCLPSIEKTEAFGVVLLEAARQGKACLVSNVEGSGMSWVVEHQKTGIVVESGEPLSISKALYQIQSDTECLQRWGKSASKRFEDMFLIDNVSQKVILLYKALLS